MRAAPFQRLQPVKRSQHHLAVVHVARQTALVEGLAEVAGVGCEYDLSVAVAKAIMMAGKHRRKLTAIAHLIDFDDLSERRTFGISR